MPAPIRVGGVEYLNTVPLLHGLRANARYEITCDVPSALARGLDAREFDVALIPVAAYLSGVGGEIVPGVSIACRGPVGTVKLFAKRPLSDVRTLALDASSRSSAALLRVILAARYGVRPECREMAPDLDTMLAQADAALLIGGTDLLMMTGGPGVEMHDLGEVWREWQGVPLVLAAWIFRRGFSSPGVAADLAESHAAGMAAIDEILSAEAAARNVEPALLKEYFTDMLDYSLGPEHVEGMTRYRELLIAEGILRDRRPITFAGGSEGHEEA